MEKWAGTEKSSLKKKEKKKEKCFTFTVIMAAWYSAGYEQGSRMDQFCFIEQSLVFGLV